MSLWWSHLKKIIRCFQTFFLVYTPKFIKGFSDVYCAKKYFLPRNRCTEPPIQEKPLRSRALYVISSHYIHSYEVDFSKQGLQTHAFIIFRWRADSWAVYHWPIVTISLTTCFVWMMVASPSIHLLYSCITAGAYISSACNHWTRRSLSKWSWLRDV